MEKGRRGYKRQLFKFRAQEDESLLGDTGRPLECPDLGATLPPAPQGLANSRPRLWLAGPNVISTPKRERELSPDDSDVTTDIPEAKRCLSETNYEGQNGKAPAPHPGQRYSLDVSNKSPPGLPIGVRGSPRGWAG